MANLTEVFKGMEIEAQIERDHAKKYISTELGENITNMSFEEIADAVQEAFEIGVETLADILETDMALDFSNDDSYRYMLNIRECPCCHKEVKRSDMAFTKDCNGIPFRLLCHNCYEKEMAKGYDGEYYTEADECLDEDY